MNNSKQTDILVIGFGLADAVAAIFAADKGKNVTIITKSPLLKSDNTPNTQGRIVYTSGTDSPKN